MRWSNLTLEDDEQRRLPGYRDEAVVRRFDAPEALETNFYEVRAKSVLNRVPRKSQMPFRWTINPYRGCSHACVYCFARPTHKYLDFNAGRDFEREIVVKVNAPEVLRVELAKPVMERGARGTGDEHRSVPVGGGEIPADGGHLGGDEGLRESVFGADEVPAVTAGPAADAANRTAGDVQRVFVDPDARREGLAGDRAAHAEPRARLEAVAELNRAGIPTGVLIAPLMPGVNDAPHQVEPLLEAATGAGATSIGGVALHLRGEVRGIFMDWLRSQRPDLLERYEELYRRGAYAPQEERERLSQLVRRGPGRARGIRRTRPAARPPAAETLQSSHQQALF